MQESKKETFIKNHLDIFKRAEAKHGIHKNWLQLLSHWNNFAETSVAVISMRSILSFQYIFTDRKILPFGK